MLTAFKLAKLASRAAQSHQSQRQDDNMAYSSSTRNPFENTPSSFPTVPPSLSAGGHGMREDHAAQGQRGPGGFDSNGNFNGSRNYNNNYSNTNTFGSNYNNNNDINDNEKSGADMTADGVPRLMQHSLQDVTPYLGLRARLSQVWINRWTVLILLVLVRVLLAIGSLRHDIDSAKAEALSACTTVESMGSAMASLPHYLSTGVNALAAHGVTSAVNGLHSGLFDIISAAEEIFVFWVNMAYGMYECLITFAVTGSLHALIGATEDITKFVNSTLGSIQTDLKNDVQGFQSTLKSFLNGLNSAENFFTGGKSTPPTLDITSSLNKMSTLQLPSSINQELHKINASIPNFDQVRNFTNTVLRTPFEEVKALMNKSLGTFEFDKSVFPTPARKQLSFCSDNDGIDSFFALLYDVCDTARKIFIGVCLVAAVLACIPMAMMEIRRWRSTRDRAIRMQVHGVDPIDKVYIASRPMTARVGIKLASKFRTPKMQVLARWFVAYCTSVPALVLLSIGVAGLFSSLCQFILLKAIEREVPILAHDIGAFADKVVQALDNASAEWSNGTNTLILKTNHDINKNVFSWVNISTHALNDTLNSFTNQTMNVLNATFGGTVLYEPILEVYNCLIGLKVAGIEHGLTWVSDHAHVDFPLFPNDTFSAGASAAINGNATTAQGTNNSFLADPGDSASDKITQAVLSLADKLAAGIRTEALLATALLLLYLFVCACGLAYVAFAALRRTRGRAEGGPSYAGDIDRPGPPRAASYEMARPGSPRGQIPATAPPLYEQATRERVNNPFQARMPTGTTVAHDFGDGGYYASDEKAQVARKEVVMPRF